MAALKNNDTELARLTKAWDRGYGRQTIQTLSIRSNGRILTKYKSFGK